MRILVIEDEEELCSSIAEGLTISGYAVDTCGDGLEAYELLMVENYDLAVLDLNLPHMDGIQILQKVREENKELKILILSARCTVPDKVAGLNGGANDYLAKPFDFDELEARIRNLLHRSFVQVDTTLTVADIVLDTVKRQVTINGSALKLTRKEFGILEYLMLNVGKVISQEELMEHVWNSEADSFSNAIRVHMASLRKKLKESLTFDPIETKIGQGYLLE